ncbi:MAG: hypothetical protein E7183_08335 [Erysipelotrichaceae bacterium]|nr:hypothetical protein [Erysipelotrichaceae bacterium]
MDFIKCLVNVFNNHQIDSLNITVNGVTYDKNFKISYDDILFADSTDCPSESLAIHLNELVDYVIDKKITIKIN